MFVPNKLIFHASDTKVGWMSGRSLVDQCQEIGRWHRKRGFNMFGYHWAIGRDGELLSGRPQWMMGAHCKDKRQNHQSLGVVLIGGHGGNERDDFYDHFTSEQMATSQRLIKHLDLPVHGHNEYAAKACPCFTASETF